jgi:hypothetical protein
MYRVPASRPITLADMKKKGQTKNNKRYTNNKWNNNEEARNGSNSRWDSQWFPPNTYSSSLQRSASDSDCCGGCSMSSPSPSPDNFYKRCHARLLSTNATKTTFFGF